MFKLVKSLFKKMHGRPIWMFKKYVVIQGKKKYLIDNPVDLKVFNLIKELESEKLKPEDKKQVKFIKTQLDKEWQKYLLVELNKMKKLYK